MRDQKLRVELDRKALFALASDTRMDILKSLQTDRRTLTQLAELLDVDKAAVHRHLKKLEEGGFVVRADDHGFVYYSLTWRARDIISPGENTRIIVLISSAFVLLLAAVLIFSFVSNPVNEMAKEASAGTDNDQGGEVGVTNQAQDSSLIFIGMAILTFTALTLSYFAVRLMRRPKQPHPSKEDLLALERENVVID